MIKNNRKGLMTRIGHALYRASVALREFGESSHLASLAHIGKFGRDIALMFPVTMRKRW